MNETTVKNDFTQGTTSGTIVRLAIPMIMAQMVNILYNIVDRMYLGHMPGDGRLALTGVGVAFPIITIINAFANLCGTGGAPLCSIERGRGDIKKAELIMGNSISLLLIFGVILTFLGYVLKTPLLYLFGASDHTIGYANDYMNIYLLGNIFVMLGLGMTPYLDSQGFTKYSMYTSVIGAGLNLVLDPLFIFSLNMGVRGAALATILSQMVSCALVLCFLRSRRAILKLRLENLRLSFKVVKDTIALGLSGFTMSMTDSFVQIVCNSSLQFYGGDLYVGAMTIIFSIRNVVQMPMQGFTHGSRPVLGYNYGAGRNDRVKEGIRFITWGTLAYAIGIWAILMLFPEMFIRLFNGEEALLKVAVVSLRVHFAIFFFMALQLCGQTVFVSLGKAKQAVFFSLFRKAILGVPLTLLLPHLFDLGIYGVLAAEPVTNIIGGLACYLTMIAVVWKKL